MPRSFVNRQQYKEDSIGGWVVGQLFKKNLKKSSLAERLDITLHGLAWKLHNNSFNYSDLLVIFDFLDSSDEEILQVMKLTL